MNVDLLNNLIEETTVQMAELEGQIRTAEAELREGHFPALNRCGRSTPS